MKLSVKPKSDCFFDVAALGEVMLRLDPGEGRIKTSNTFTAYEGGGEYNVAQGLAKCFGMKSAVITALADNEIGRLIERLILADAVDTSLIKWMPYDGIGRSVRNGINFTERGLGVRKALGVSDRANSAASAICADDIDFDRIFGQLGVRWLHTGGIFAALSENSLATLIACIKKAREYGTIVSYDLNYRASLWNQFGGEERARQVAESILPYVDVLIGNDIEYPLCLGETLEKKCDAYASARVLERVNEKYPNLKLSCAIYLTSGTYTISAVCRAEGKNTFSPELSSEQILDRVGAGDAYAAGFIYGLIQGESAEKSMLYGACHSMLSLTTPGDTSAASLSEVEALMRGSDSFMR